MSANSTTFDIYAHVRHARQRAGDRSTELIRAHGYDDPVAKKLHDIENRLNSIECEMEAILRLDQA